MPANGPSVVNHPPPQSDLAFKAVSPRARHPPDVASSNGCVKFSSPETQSPVDGDQCNGGGCQPTSPTRRYLQQTRERTQSEASSVTSSASSGRSAEFSVTPPDGGWGWVVVFAAFITNMIADGVTLSYGILYIAFLEYFRESNSKTAWVGSLFMGIQLLAGPISSSLTDRFGCRRVTIAGGLLASCGFILSSFANSLEVLFFTFGIMSGFGLALCSVAAVVIVAYYFEKRRSFATGLSLCGSGIGTFLFAPFMKHLIDQYAWRGATLILAGCFLNIVVCGALMRDLDGSTKKARSEKSLKTSTESISQKSQPTPDELRRLLQGGILAAAVEGATSASSSIPEDLKDCERLCNSLVQLPTFLKQGEHLPKELVEKMGKQGVNYEFFMENYPHLVMSHSASEQQLDTANASDHVGVCANNNNNNLLSPPLTALNGGVIVDRNSPHVRHRQGQQTTRRLSAAYFHNLRLHRRSITHRNAMLNTHRYHIRASSCPDIYRNSMITIAQEEEDEMCSFMNDLKEVIFDMVDVSYFRNLKFFVFCISNVFLFLWCDVPYVYMVDNASEKSIVGEASILVSLIGILNTLGELIFGYVGDKPWISSMLMYSASMVVCGAVVCLVPMISNFTGLAAVSGVFGFTLSANYALTSAIVVDLITLENFTNAYGLLLLVQGVASLIGLPLAGWIHDMTGSYDLSFYMAGLWIFIAGAMIIVLYIWRWTQRRAASGRVADEGDPETTMPPPPPLPPIIGVKEAEDDEAETTLKQHQQQKASRKLRYEDEELRNDKRNGSRNGYGSVGEPGVQLPPPSLKTPTCPPPPQVGEEKLPKETLL